MTVRKLLTLLAMLTALCGIAPAWAQTTHITATLVAERAVARPGETILLAIAMKPDKGWHGYWENGGDAGFGMSLAWTLPPGAKAGALRYPVPETLVINGLMNHVYEHDYALLVPLTLPANAAPGQTLALSAQADWLACTDEICVPERARIATTVRVGAPAKRDARFDGWLAKLPAPLAEPARFALTDTALRLAIPLPATLALTEPHLFVGTQQVAGYAAPQRFSRVGNLLIVELARAEPPGPAPPAVTGVLRLAGAEGLEISATPGTVPQAGEALAGAVGEGVGLAGVLAILGGALLGGLLLNVMPCVFPILSLKALSLAQANVDPAKARADAVGYTAGAVVACLGLGVIMLGLRAAGTEVGWAFQLQEPLVIAALLWLAVAITANFAGLFELPALGSGAGGRGAFATGLLAAFVATPCTGPFMAAAMGAALVLPPALALAVFGALGLGLALPFLAIGLVPRLRRLLPRPGPWMARFRAIMAVPMALTALALAWLAWRVGGATFAIAALVGAVLVLALLVFAGRRQRAGVGSAGAVLAGSVALILAGALVLPRLETVATADGETLLASERFSPAALANARGANKPVFVYFTADWCLTCKVNENAAIEREATRDAFAKAGVIVLRGDWTRRDPVITRFLAEHGAAGVPLYLWYRPGGAAITLPQVLTPSLLEACAAGTARCG